MKAILTITDEENGGIHAGFMLMQHLIASKPTNKQCVNVSDEVCDDCGACSEEEDE